MSPDEQYTRVCPETQPRTDVVQSRQDDTHPPPTPANEWPQRLGLISQWWEKKRTPGFVPKLNKNSKIRDGEEEANVVQSDGSC